MYEFAPDKNAYFDYINNVQYWYDYYAHIFVTAIKNGATDLELKSLADDQEGAFIASMATGMHFINRNNALKLVLDDLGIANDLQIKHYYKDFKFTGEREGKQLSLIEGYPSDLPALQLTKNGRFCFYSWATVVDRTTDWGSKFGKETALKSFGVLEDDYDDILGVPNTASGLNKSKNDNRDKLLKTYVYSLDQGQPRMHFNANVQKINFFGFPLIPKDKEYAEKFIAEGYPNDIGYGRLITDNHTKGAIFSHHTGKWIVSYRGKLMYANISWWSVIWLQVQYYLDAFFNVPYRIFGSVEYGESYPEYLWASFGDKYKLDHVTGFLSNVDFFKQPTGKPGFWDYLLLAVPVIVGAALSVISAGAGTPLLVAAVASAAGGLIMKEGLKQAKESLAANEMKDIYNNPDVINQNLLPGVKDVNPLDDVNYNDKPVFEDQKYTWLWLIAGIGGVYLITKNKKR